MTYLLRTTRKSLVGPNFLKILIVCIVVVVILISGFVRSTLTSILYPVFSFGGLLNDSVGVVPKFFGSTGELISENEKLSLELEKLKGLVLDNEAIKLENEELRRQIKLIPNPESISSFIVSRPPQVPLDTLLIDKGESDGVYVDKNVLAGDRVFLGNVVRSLKNQSVVSLSSFAGTVSYGFVSRTNEQIEFKGIGGGAMQSIVPIDFDVEVGDKIMKNGSLYYLAGIVSIIEENSSSGFKNVLISLPVNVSNTHIVFVEGVSI